jgi:hypothetical protein
MLCFSLTTLATTVYGDSVAVDPFARSLANLEAVLGKNSTSLSRLLAW